MGSGLLGLDYLVNGFGVLNIGFQNPPNRINGLGFTPEPINREQQRQAATAAVATADVLAGQQS